MEMMEGMKSWNEDSMHENPGLSLNDKLTELEVNRAVLSFAHVNAGWTMYSSTGASKQK